MVQILMIAVAIFAMLAALSYAAGKSAARGFEPGSNDKKPVYALLPGDIKYESPNGNFRFYFPITTSIVASVVLSLLLRLMS